MRRCAGSSGGGRVGVTPQRCAAGPARADPAVRRQWTPAAVAHARVVARMRERGHSLTSIREATAEGRLAFGYVEELFPLAGTALHAQRGRR